MKDFIRYPDVNDKRLNTEVDFTFLLSNAIKKAGKQDTLAAILQLSPSALSKRLNYEVGWTEKDINKLLEYANCEIADIDETETKIKVLQDTISILLSNDKEKANPEIETLIKSMQILLANNALDEKSQILILKKAMTLLLA